MKNDICIACAGFGVFKGDTCCICNGSGKEGVTGNGAPQISASVISDLKNFFTSNPHLRQKSTEKALKLEVDDCVYHGKFGAGEVVSVDYERAVPNATINFHTHGEKTLIIHMANLTKMN